MKIFAIRDESMQEQADLAYLLYYETEKRFYIELPQEADSWTTPLLLSSFVKKGERTVNSYWSKIWVQQRIVPSDRQNLGSILKDNGLKEYDEFELLMLAMGRCAQDDYYLAAIEQDQLPDEILQRFQTRIEDVVPLEDCCLLVFFRDGSVRKCSMKSHFEKKKAFQILLNRPDYFSCVNIQPGGYGVEWDINMSISDSALYHMGKKVPLTASDFQSFVSHRIVNVAEAAEILGCSRQNIDYLTKTGKLHPVKSTEKNTLYLKSEILKRNWQ